MQATASSPQEYYLGESCEEKAKALSVLLQGRGSVANKIRATLQKNRIAQYDIDDVIMESAHLFLRSPDKSENLPDRASEDVVLRFLTVIVRYQSLAVLRKAYGRKGYPAPERLREDYEGVCQNPSPEKAAMLQEFSEHLQNKMATLTSPQRRLIKMRFFDKKSYAEMAEERGCKITTVCGALGKLKQKLRKDMSAHE